MRIADALQRAGDSAAPDHQTLYLNGSIERHSDNKYFRMYYDASQTREYWVIKTDDVVGDLHEWTESELSSTAFAGQKRFRVGLRYGASIEFIKVEIHRLGETLAGHDALTEKTLAGTCRGTSGCSTGCCTQSSGGGTCYCDRCCIA